MSMGSEFFSVVKKVFLVSDQLDRLTVDVKELTQVMNDHEVRLAVIENTLTLTARSSKLILPGR